MGSVLHDRIQRRLSKLKQRFRFRELSKGSGIDLTSNDYLSLTDHPKVRQAMIHALESGIPLGSGGSRLLRGNTAWHVDLEARLAAFKQAETTLIFNSGFEANVGVLSTLCRPGDVVFADRLVHASMIDGLKQSKADRHFFPHNDVIALQNQLETAPQGRARFIVVESLYSMDGDLAPLPELAALAREYDAHLIVDEAHATGVFGQRGSGLLEHFGLLDAPLVTIHTCGKAWGSFGAFISCSNEVRDFLVNHCRPFIFTTALPPLIPQQWLSVLDIIQGEPWRREKVLAHATRFREALSDHIPFQGTATPIVPIVIGDEARTLAAATHLQEEGFDIRAIRPPSVPKGTSRLRIALNAGLADDDLDRLIRACRHILSKG